MKTSARLALFVTALAVTHSVRASDVSGSATTIAPKVVAHDGHHLLWAALWGGVWYMQNPNNIVAKSIIPKKLKDLLGHTRVADVKQCEAEGLGKLQFVGEQAGNALVTSAILANATRWGLSLANGATHGKIPFLRAGVEFVDKCPLVVGKVRG